MSQQNPTHKKAMIQALEKSLGVVTSACKEVEDVENIALDFAESQLHKQISEGNTSGTIFYLKTKGKKRGYVERQEVHQETTYKSLDINIIDTGVPLASSEKDIVD